MIVKAARMLNCLWGTPGHKSQAFEQFLDLNAEFLVNVDYIVVGELKVIEFDYCYDSMLGLT
jgi:hypothetical protein